MEIKEIKSGKLKPCPFCGSTDLDFYVSTERLFEFISLKGRASGTIGCNNCNANICHSEEFKIDGRLSLVKINEVLNRKTINTKNKIIRKWNKRHTDVEMQKELRKYARYRVVTVLNNKKVDAIFKRVVKLIGKARAKSNTKLWNKERDTLLSDINNIRVE